MSDLPRFALSVRQPSAWAIIHGNKLIERRSLGSIRTGRMIPGHICIHAATGMSENAYRYLHWRLAERGVSCPRPDDLIRGAIIGTVEVIKIVTPSNNARRNEKAGLLLAYPKSIDPIPANGALGYFEWTRGATFAPTKPWMTRFGRASADTMTGALFSDAPLSYKEPPEKPWFKG